MNILILGRGVLGEALHRSAVAGGHTVRCLSRRDGFDIADIMTYPTAPFDVVINAAGVIDPSSVKTMADANTIGPRLLCQIFSPVIHISTDCVFAPENGRLHYDYDQPQPDRNDMYSLTKYLGEDQSRQLVVRTSFVGPGSRMWRDIQKAAFAGTDYPGWAQFWSGSHVDEVAGAIIDLVVPHALVHPTGVIHLATSNPIRKYRVAEKIANVIKMPVKLHLTFDGPQDRLLAPTEGFQLMGKWGELDADIQ